ncbi:unnamed protein product, partial [Adineta ricciae]
MLCHTYELLLFLVQTIRLYEAKVGGTGPGSSNIFSPDLTDFDAYGNKAAANDYMTVLVQPESQTVIVQFAPYNYSVPAITCTFGTPSFYIYSVAVGRNQVAKQFVFNGEDSTGNAFLGIAVYNSSSPCTFTWYTRQISNTHQEFSVINVDPTGSVAYGAISKVFFVYQLTSPYSQINNHTLPDIGFMPHAIDVQGSSVVLAGYTNASLTAPELFKPVVYLMDTSGSIKDTWNYTASNGSWQEGLTNLGADSYAARFDMSIDISDTGGLVLVGIQSINTAFTFSINNVNSPTNLALVNSISNGKTAVGFGKAVAFLDSAGTTAAILNNIYTVLDYEW